MAEKMTLILIDDNGKQENLFLKNGLSGECLMKASYWNHDANKNVFLCG
jgi:hypothetical protein